MNEAKPVIGVREGRLVERRAVEDLVPGDLVQHYSKWDQTYGDPIRRRVVGLEFGPDPREHEHVVTWIDPGDRDAEPYETREKSGCLVDVIVGRPPRTREMVIDMLCAAQGEAYRSWYESDGHGRKAVDRALAVLEDDTGGARNGAAAS